MTGLRHPDTGDTRRHNKLHTAGTSLEHAEQGLSDQIAAIADQHPSVSLDGIRTAMADLNEAVRMHKDGMEALGSDSDDGGAHASGGHVSGGQAVRHDDDATSGETQKSLDESKASAEGKQSTASKDAKDDDHKRGEYKRS